MFTVSTDNKRTQSYFGIESLRKHVYIRKSRISVMMRELKTKTGGDMEVEEKHVSPQVILGVLQSRALRKPTDRIANLHHTCCLRNEQSI